MQTNDTTAILNLRISQELLARDLLRMAYVAKDGTPRNVPIACTPCGATPRSHSRSTPRCTRRRSCSSAVEPSSTSWTASRRSTCR